MKCIRCFHFVAWKSVLLFKVPLLSLSVLQFMDFYLQRWQTWFFRSVSPHKNKDLFLVLPSPGCSSVTASTTFHGVCLISSGHKAVVKGVCAEMCAEMTLLCSQPPVKHCHIQNVGLSGDNFRLSFCYLSKVRAWNPLFFFVFCF